MLKRRTASAGFFSQSGTIKMHETLDIYSDYLICQNNKATATGLADLLCGEISHDKFTRFLNGKALGSAELWIYIKGEVRRNEKKAGGVLILDDSIEEKPYTDENEIMCWLRMLNLGMLKV